MPRVWAEDLLRSQRPIEGALRPSTQSVAAPNDIARSIDVKSPAPLQVSTREYRDPRAYSRNIETNIRQGRCAPGKRLDRGVIVLGFPVDAVALRGVV